MIAPMPKLSEQLTGPKHPRLCQGCGGKAPLIGARWREHDEADRPTTVVIVLCAKCEKREVEKHPRLYSRLRINEPHPGSMAICGDCRYRDGTRCAHPDLKANGGAGPMIRVPEPTRVRLLRSPRRLSGWETLWPSEPKECAGREEAAVEEA